MSTDAATTPTAAVAFTRELPLATYPRQSYRTSKQRPTVLKGLHLGQRKLLLSEIEFLTLAVSGRLFAPTATPAATPAAAAATSVSGGDFHLMIYAGAAPGNHTPYLRSLFADDVAYILIDPAPFDRHLLDIATRVFSSAARDIVGDDDAVLLPDRASDVVVIRDFCTPALCTRIRAAILKRRATRNIKQERSVLFVSDIRVGDMNRTISNAQATEIIMADNELQRMCCEAVARGDGLLLDAAMLKFRPPFPRQADPKGDKYDAADTTPDTIAYYAGRIFLGVWAPKSSTEVRLVVTKFGQSSSASTTTTTAEMTTYDCRAFEEQLCYFNAHDRYAADVAAERVILSQYLEWQRSNNNIARAHDDDAGAATAEGAALAVENLSKEISVQLYANDLFRPLARDAAEFTEDAARLWCLLFVSCHVGTSLCSVAAPAAAPAAAAAAALTTMPAAVDLFQRLRRDVTIRRVLAGDESCDGMRALWRDFATGARLGEWYQFLPWVHAKLLAVSRQRLGGGGGGDADTAVAVAPQRRDRAAH